MAPKTETSPSAGPAPTSEFEAIGNAFNKSGDGQDEDDEKIVQEIESLCMNCHENVS